MIPAIIRSPFKNRDNCTFSILIPSWNNLGYLKNCIDSIRKNSAFEHQIIVMINEGADGTVEWAKSRKDLDFVHAETNIGICYGLNACRPLVQTPYIVYANDDMYFLQDWDKPLKEEIESLDHNLFMFSATMVEPTDTGNPCVIVADFGDSPETFKESGLTAAQSRLHKNDWNGSSWPPNLLHIDTWDLVGGMSTEFSPGMYSDPDLSRKLWEAGVRYYKGLGNSRVYHFGSKSTGRVKKNKGRDTFTRKWGISPGTFYRFYLKLGTEFSGPLTDPVLPGSTKLKSLWKRVKLAFTKP